MSKNSQRRRETLYRQMEGIRPQPKVAEPALWRDPVTWTGVFLGSVLTVGLLWLTWL